MRSMGTLWSLLALLLGGLSATARAQEEERTSEEREIETLRRTIALLEERVRVLEGEGRVEEEIAPPEGDLELLSLARSYVRLFGRSPRETRIRRLEGAESVEVVLVGAAGGGVHDEVLTFARREGRWVLLSTHERGW